MADLTVDRDQLAALRAVRAGFGEVEVLEVLAGRQLGRSPALAVLERTHEQRRLVRRPEGPAPASTCSCHSSDLYVSLWRCPACEHRSFDAYTWASERGQPVEGSCERRACGYEGPYPSLAPEPVQGQLHAQEEHR